MSLAKVLKGTYELERKHVQAPRRAALRSKRVRVKGVWGASCAPGMREMLMKSVRDQKTFLKVLRASKYIY